MIPAVTAKNIVAYREENGGFTSRAQLKKVPKLDKIALWLEARAAKNSDKVNKYATLGLFVFVALPLPGTGAWTGALVGALLNIRLKWLLPAIFAGVVTAGVIMSILTYGAGALIGLV